MGCKSHFWNRESSYINATYLISLGPNTPYPKFSKTCRALLSLVHCWWCLAVCLSGWRPHTYTVPCGTAGRCWFPSRSGRPHKNVSLTSQRMEDGHRVELIVFCLEALPNGVSNVCMTVLTKEEFSLNLVGKQTILPHNWVKLNYRAETTSLSKAC